MRKIKSFIWVFLLLWVSLEVPQSVFPEPAGRLFFPSEQVISSSHFEVYHEAPYAPAGVLNTLEGLHAKILLDLNSFAPWAHQEKIKIYLFQSSESYHLQTKSPALAGGHIEIEKKTIYVFESPHFARTMAHELAHLFFEQFFKDQGKTSPLWLTEGVAMTMEIDYGASQNEKIAYKRHFRGKNIPLTRFFSFNYRHSWNNATVSQWYAQAYSLVRFLMKRFSNAQFVVFCQKIRENKTIDEALLSGYGLQMADVLALERLWTRDLNQ